MIVLRRNYWSPHGWMKRDSKRLVSRRRKKREASSSLLTAHGNGPHVETRYCKVYDGKVFD